MRGPVTVACLEPGLAWMVMETEDGGTARIHAGNLGVETAGAGD